MWGRPQHQLLNDGKNIRTLQIEVIGHTQLVCTPQFKNILTGEIKTICPRNFDKYDFSVWKHCHRNGDLWED